MGTLILSTTAGLIKGFSGMFLLDCKRATTTKADFDCKNDILSVRWPTDVTYGTVDSQIPHDTYNSIRGRIDQQLSTLMSLVVISRVPPYVTKVYQFLFDNRFYRPICNCTAQIQCSDSIYYRPLQWL